MDRVPEESRIRRPTRDPEAVILRVPVIERSDSSRAILAAFLSAPVSVLKGFGEVGYA
jgi:hypothetical protein